jgi:hypothetical protein
MGCLRPTIRVTLYLDGGMTAVTAIRQTGDGDPWHGELG